MTLVVWSVCEPAGPLIDWTLVNVVYLYYFEATRKMGPILGYLHNEIAVFGACGLQFLLPVNDYDQ